MSNVDLPKPKPSKLKRAVEQIKSGIKNVGKEYKAGNIPLTIPSIAKKLTNKYRKPQNIEVPESMKSVFMKAANEKFKRNKTIYGSRQSAIKRTRKDIREDPALSKMMTKIQMQKNKKD
jgi:hypothetical protein